MIRTWLLPLALSAMLLGISPALPYPSVIRTSPPSDGTAQKAPRDVAIVFSERVEPSPGDVVVQDANGTRVDLRDARSENNGRVVRTSLRPLLPGTYKVMWRVRSAEGRPAEGGFTFRVRP